MDGEGLKAKRNKLAEEAKSVSAEGDADTSLISLGSPERFINRELSWLAFNERVLEAAESKKHPLLERLRFLSISASNLNEFYMVRVAGLRGQVEAKVDVPSQEGLTPRQQLELVNARAIELMHNQQKCWRRIVRSLKGEDIHVLEGDELRTADKTWLRKFFLEKLFSVLSPIAVDPAHPFPFLPNLGFALVLALKKGRRKETLNALVPLPHLVERFIRLPGDEHRFVALETVVTMYVDKLFPGFRVAEVGQCRVLRDSDIEIEEEAEDLVRLYESALKERRRGSVIRLTINHGMSSGLRKFLVGGLDAAPETVFALKGLLGLADTGELIVDNRPDLVFAPYAARFPERVLDFGGDCFQAIKAKDFVVHHPYESFDVVAQFLRQAADDPDVIAIKQTLYRTSENSPIVAALIDAAEAGKSVTALVEVKARFDEERNIRWARDLERAGVQVVYGFVHLKTHAKISLVVRREGKQFQSYCHFGTGNYHPITARIYTDLSFFSCDPALCRDAAWLFHFTTGTAGPVEMEKLSVSPVNMRATLIDLINDEIKFVRQGRPGTIWVKLNALVDGEIIDALYKASQAGVKIHLVVRGICCLRPGVSGLSENITVQSIIGRFLEHARIICFGGGHAMPSEKAKVFISSADWMPRNLNRRVEILVPIENPTVHRQIIDQIMDANFKDKAQSWILQPDGTYRRRSRSPKSFSTYEYFMTNPSLSGRGSALKTGISKEPSDRAETVAKPSDTKPPAA
ncbi:MAG: RNA degradosome polyphosphate kinase [Alphaproteobacteria bacterium]|nr:RNA degradosome polyphosphate kinase [Alphaproteobacteria bacterium]